jgi:hypothetical protein
VTDGEALKLQPGDPLMGTISGQFTVLDTVQVEMITHATGAVKLAVWVRRAGKDARGKPFPTILRRADRLARLPRPNAPAFHVAADWLDEHGEPMAAHKLRRAFPLGDGPGVPAAGAGGG